MMSNNVKFQTVAYVSIHDVQNILDSKHHSNYLYDYNKSAAHFDDWCDKMGYGDIDPEGKKRGSSQVWFKEYEMAPDGMKSCPIRLNLFNYLSEKYIIDSGTVFFELDTEWIDSYGHPSWVTAVLKEIHSEFAHLFPSGTVVIRLID